MLKLPLCILDTQFFWEGDVTPFSVPGDSLGPEMQTTAVLVPQGGEESLKASVLAL